MTETTEEIVLDLNENINEDKKDETLKRRELSALKEEEEVKKPEPKIIPAKRIDELTDEEKKILIENARAGIDNPYYSVKLYKNGITHDECSFYADLNNLVSNDLEFVDVKDDNGESIGQFRDGVADSTKFYAQSVSYSRVKTFVDDEISKTIAIYTYDNETQNKRNNR